MNNKRRLISGIVITFFVISFIFTISSDLIAEDGSTYPVISIKEDAQGKLMPIELPTVDNKEKFNDLIKKYDYTKNKRNIFGLFDISKSVNETAFTVADSEGIVNTASAPVESAEFSATNVQVQGVDEADIIKTDGKYIYQIGDKRVNIIKALPADNMELVSTIHFDNNLNVLELYLDDSRLTVLLTGWNKKAIFEPKNDETTIDNGASKSQSSKESPEVIVIGGPYQSSYVKAMVYDITDINKPALIKEVITDGNYISSRKIDNTVYVVANKNLDFQLWHKNAEEALPFFKDSSNGEDISYIPFKDIKYFPEISQPNFLNIVSFETIEAEKQAKIQSYLGAGSTLYASASNLYVVSNNRDTKSSIMKFDLDGLDVYPVAKGEVEGYLINQFSMDEHNGYFRVATNNFKANALYVLDQKLSQIGKIENIAPTERIYSVRFMGERAYMVTFKNTDPLFAIDLKDPYNPQIMGQLKIPGFSNYLHPYDENHIIGFGKDTIEMEIKDVNGNSTGRTTAFTMGMKISVFDVTDMENPKEIYVEKIGDRGTESTLLQNHKALLFNKGKSLLAFPVNVNEVLSDIKYENYGMPKYGTPTFQGAYVYNFDLENGFKLKGKITNMTKENLLKTGYGYNRKSQIERIIYIGDVLYTLSDNMIKASNIADIKELSSLKLPVSE